MIKNHVDESSLVKHRPRNVRVTLGYTCTWVVVMVTWSSKHGRLNQQTGVISHRQGEGGGYNTDMYTHDSPCMVLCHYRILVL